MASFSATPEGSPSHADHGFGLFLVVSISAKVSRKWQGYMLEASKLSTLITCKWMAASYAGARKQEDLKKTDEAARLTSRPQEAAHARNVQEYHTS